MSKLEDTVKELSKEYHSNPDFRFLTINDLAMANVVNMAHSLKLEIREESQRHLIEIKKLERKRDNVHTAGLIISGRPGFLRCPQGWANLESEFTTLQEVIKRITEPMIDLSMERINVPFGMELWAIDDKGMMTMIDAKRDSSD